MIFWIEKEYKDEFKDSAKASGIRCQFYDYGTSFDDTLLDELNSFIAFLRRRYYFPVRLNVLFCKTKAFKHSVDDHTYYGAFYNMDDEKRKIYPRISIAAHVNKYHTLQDVLFSLAHEITHYYQWYFLEEDKRTSRSLETEANKWAKYILDLYSCDNAKRSLRRDTAKR